MENVKFSSGNQKKDIINCVRAKWVYYLSKERNNKGIVFLKQTLNEKNLSSEELKSSVDYIIKQLENYEKIPKDAKLKKFMGKSRYKDECLENITSHINNLKYSSSEDLDMLRKVKFGVYGEKDAKVFDAKKAFDGMVKYSNDAIKLNKISQSLFIKRFLFLLV